MPVSKPNSEYHAMAGQWKRCTDVYDGQARIHAAGIEYLPKLKDQDVAEYNAYVMRAIFYNATYRTITGLVGMIFRKPPKVELPPKVMDMADDIDMSGTPLHLQAQDIATEALKLGRIGILVDYPSVASADPGKVVTLADAATMNLRPTMCTYTAKSIINWRTGQVKNKTVLVLVVLEECRLDPEDEFSTKEIKQWRVLSLTNNVYSVRVYERVNDKEVLIFEFVPLMNNKPLDYIPFQFIGTDDVSPEIDVPPLIDLVDLNISHYQSTADLEHGAHFTGLPTPVISGYKPEKDGEKFYIGSSFAWVFPNEHAKASYLEFTGTGLTALETRLEKKEAQMAIMGARMLEPHKRGVETAETETIHRKGEESMLSSVSQCISLGVTQALKWFTEWAGADPASVVFELNRDFYPIVMTPQELTALVAAWQQGAISDQTLFDNLQKGEIISQDRTLEEEQAAIGDAAARFAAQQAAVAGAVAGAVTQAEGGGPGGPEPVKKAA